MGNSELLIERAQEVSDAANVLYGAAFGVRAKYPEVDYLTVYAKSLEEEQHLSEEAQHLGELVFQKHGGVYQLTKVDDELSTNIVRIGDPDEENRLLGGVDFILPKSISYPEIKNLLVVHDSYEEKIEENLEYSVSMISDENLGVRLSFASLRITERVMGITSAR